MDVNVSAAAAGKCMWRWNQQNTPHFGTVPNRFDTYARHFCWIPLSNGRYHKFHFHFHCFPLTLNSCGFTSECVMWFCRGTCNVWGWEFPISIRSFIARRFSIGSSHNYQTSAHFSSSKYFLLPLFLYASIIIRKGQRNLSSNAFVCGRSWCSFLVGSIDWPMLRLSGTARGTENYHVATATSINTDIFRESF